MDFVVCSYCWKEYKIEKGVLRYSHDVNYYFRKNGNLASREPAHNPACSLAQEKDVRQMIYLLQYAIVFIPKDFDGIHQPLVSRLASQLPEREVFWYLDDAFLRRTVNKHY